MIRQTKLIIHGRKGGELQTVLAAMISAIAGSIGFYLSILFPQVRIVSIVICMAMQAVYIVGRGSIKQYGKCIVVLFLISCILAGLLAILDSFAKSKQTYIEGAVYFATSVWFGGLFVRKGMNFMKELTLHRSQHATVTLNVQGRKATCLGFWDSGNSLRDPISKRAVVLLEKSIMEKNHIPIPVKGFRVIPYNSIGMDHGVLKGFVADEMTVEEESGYERTYAKVVVAIYEGKLSIKDDYQMILNTHLE